MSRIILEYETITKRQIPVITCYPEGGEKLPLVLLNHGTTGSAEGNLSFAVRLAKEGFFCVAIDALWHGRRSDKRLFEYLESKVYKENYLSLLLHMAKDMSVILDFYASDGRIDGKKVGMTGISQGGYVAFMTLTKENRVTAAAPLIGSPDLEDRYGNSPPWDEIAPEVQREVMKQNPLRHYEKIFPTALLIQASIEDTVVPIHGIRRLDEKLRPLYQSCPENYQLIEYPDIGHETPDLMIERAIEWLALKLK